MARRLLLYIGVLALAGGMLPMTAGASACDDVSVVIFGKPGAANIGAVPGVVNAATGTCPDVDMNYLFPGSTSVSVRLIGLDLGKSIPSVPAVLNGLGFKDKAISLKRTEATGGGIVYDSTDYGISGTGQITAVVKTPQGDFTGSFKTLP